MGSFTKEDKDNAVKFGKILIDRVKMEMTIPQLIEFHKLLVWYNSLTLKIEEHILELVKVTEEPKPENKE